MGLEARRGERGWTLPLIWLLLLGIAAVLYLGGVRVLAAIALLAGVVVVGTVVFTVVGGIYARLTNKPVSIGPLRANYSVFHFRLESDLDLPALERRLAGVFETRQYARDFDDGWERIRSATPDGGLELWLTRHAGKGNEQQDPGPNPVLVIVTVNHPDPAQQRPDRRAFGRALVGALGTKVEAGAIEWLGGASLGFEREETYRRG